ncbi:MAG: type II toxin-antitoxin system VapC family toxin [Beijerinckiaceae bacterium]
MKLLLDTHTLIWFLAGHKSLTSEAHTAIESQSNDVFVSAVSAIEVTNKFRLGKLSLAELLARNFERTILEHGFAPLPITIGHASLAGRLEIPHKDPFDRLLIAQAQIEQLTLISNEQAFDEFGIMRLW